MSKFTINKNPTPVPAAKRAELLANPGFGTLFTDHMAIVKWDEEHGWHDAQIKAYGPLSMDPASAVLHYAQEIFEGMKAYRRPDGKITLFRPEMNAARFARSATRMQMPPVPEELFLDAVNTFVQTDKDWVPEGSGSLYIRPFMIASAAFLGVKPANEYLFMVIASPVGFYFSGKASVSIWVSKNISRAGPGGTGRAKCGGNYAASLAAQAEGKKNGCDQVVFLDSIEHKWIEELGGMNIFFVFDNGELVTPPLTETILDGITRDSVIHLAKKQGLKVIERKYDFDSWKADAASGKLLETFACGTAAVITPVGEVRSEQGHFTIGNGGAGQIATKLRNDLLDIQYGRAEDPFGWVKTVA